MDQIISAPKGIWMVWSTVGYSICDSLNSALRKAYILYTAGEGAPYAIGHVGTDARLDANQIMQAWKELGWH